MKRLTKMTTLMVAVVATAGLGVGAGAAFGAAPALFAPEGVSAKVPSQPMPEPEYEENADGLSYGSAALAPEPESEPDLIAAVGTNGVEGYVSKDDLDAVNGADAAESFTTPEEALAWQEAQGAIDHTIPVYEEDGTTVVGKFLVEGSE